jgi:hypothetical protein
MSNFLPLITPGITPVSWWTPFCSSFQFSVLRCVVFCLYFVCLRHVSFVPNVISVSGLSILNCPIRLGVSLTFIYNADLLKQHSIS